MLEHRTGQGKVKLETLLSFILPHIKDKIKEFLTLNAVIYARYSSENQSEESITAQLRACTEYAHKNGYTIIHEYIDRAMTARSDARPEFQQMIADSRKKAFQAVIVHKLDRFSRDRYDHAIYRKELRKNNVKLMSVLENLDDSPESVVLESVLEGFSEYYSKNLARETRKGLREVALKAQYTGGYRPFGYDIDNDKRYVINPIEAAAVRRIFKACYEQTGYDQLLADFRREGIKTITGHYFAKTAFHAILRNEKYIGTYIYYPEGTARQKKSVPIKIEDAIPAIIDKNIFWEVQKLMDNRKHTGRLRAKEPYLLSGLLFCEKCGAPMVGHRSAKKNGYVYYSYECSKNTRNKTCSMNSVNRDAVEKTVCEYIQRLLSATCVKEIADHLTANCELINRQNKVEQAELEKELKSLERKMDNTIELLIDMPSDMLKSKLAELESRRQQLQHDLKKLDATMFTEKKIDKYIIRTENFSSMSREEKQIFIRKIIKKVTVHEDGHLTTWTTYSDVPDITTDFHDELGGATQN